MFSKLVKRNVKCLFNQKRYNSDVISNNYDFNDVIPFSFTEIHKIVKKQDTLSDKSIHIDKIHKNIFYKFIRHTNAIIYSNVSLKKSSSKIVKQSVPNLNVIDLKTTKDDSHTSESALPSDSSGYHETDDDIVCNQIERILGSLNKDNLIIVLQRSLSSNYYLKSKCWHRLTTKTLRHCFLNEQALNSNDLVKILASLSKWRFHGLSEFENKFDFWIIMNSDWSIYQASHVLWSLCHLNLFTLKGFDYLNGIITNRLNSSISNNLPLNGSSASEVATNELANALINNEQELNWQDNFYKNIHRIASANLTRLSKTGINSHVLPSIHDYLARNLVLLKCLDTKSMLSLTSLFPHSTYNDQLMNSVLEILISSFHNFTQVQAAQILFNFSVIYSNLSPKAQDLLIKLLYKFRVLVLSSDYTFIPSVVCKLLYSTRVFLNNFDSNFVSKCLSDLNANLHLIGPFSLVGNMLCLNQLQCEFGDSLDNRQKESVSNTVLNLVKLDANGNLSKPIDGSLVPLDNLKLWHFPIINNNANHYICNIYNKYNEFYETCNAENYMAAMKNLVLFMSNSFGNRDFMDIQYRNLTLLTCSKLYNSSTKNDILSSYWHTITCYLQCFNLLNVFKREVEFELTHPTNISSALMNFLTSIFQDTNESSGNLYESGLNYLSGLDQSRVLENDEIAIIKFWTLVRMCKADMDANQINIEDISKELFNNFYSSANIFAGNLIDKNDAHISDKNHTVVDELMNKIDLIGNKLCDESKQYLLRCLKSTCKPTQIDFLYSKLFFLQDHPKYFINIVPSVVIGEALTTRVYENDISMISKWLQRAKGWKCLSKYLNSNRASIKYEPSTGSEGDNDEVNAKKTQIIDFYSNWQISEMEINYILENQYVGPWLCPYVLKGNLNQTILIFPMKHKMNKTTHIFDKIRRDVLSKFGYNFIELFYH